MRALLISGALLLFCLSCKTSKIVTQKTNPLYSYDIEEKLQSMEVELIVPKAPKGANIVRAVRTGNLLFLSGKGPTKPDGTNFTGKVGSDLNIEEGYQAARLVALNQLAILKDEIGDLNKVVRVVKVFGMVNATPELTQQSQVINGFSDLIVDIFGERGKHARAAVGMASLPGNIAVEVDMIVEIQD